HLLRILRQRCDMVAFAKVEKLIDMAATATRPRNVSKKGLLDNHAEEPPDEETGPDVTSKEAEFPVEE
ncbi:hypothetical protein BGZ72_006757, partial [Mortierella alpina]